MKKIFALTLLSAAIIASGCSSDDDDDDGGNGPVVDGGTDNGGVDNGGTDNGGVDNGGTDNGGVDNGGTDNGQNPPAADMATLPAGADYDPSTLETPPTLNLLELASNVSILSTLVSTVGNNCPDLVTALGNADARLTVFAPSDDAFASAEATAALGEDDADVCAIVSGHVLADTVASAEVLTDPDNIGKTLTTLAGTTLTIGTNGQDGLTLNGIEVSGTDNFATNGVAHVLDGVLLPMDTDGGTDGGTDGETDGGGDNPPPVAGGSVQAGVQGSADNSEFAALFATTFGAETLDERATPEEAWTIFAPTNASIPDDFAGEALPLLRDHIISSGKLTLEQLSSMSEIVTNLGTSYQIGGTADAPTINGVAIGSVIGEDDNTIVYSLDGLLDGSL